MQEYTSAPNAQTFATEDTSRWDVCSPGIVDELSQAICALECQILNYEIKLAPVTKPDYCNPSNETLAQPEALVSPIRDQLNRIISGTSRLVYLYDRLEV